MGIRFIILAGLLAGASVAQAGPMSFGGSGAVKSTFAVGTLSKVGEFGSIDFGALPSTPMPSGVVFVSPANSPAPSVSGSNFSLAPPVAAPLVASPAPVAPAAAPATPLAPVTDAAAPPAPAPIADIGNSEELIPQLLPTLIPPSGVEDIPGQPVLADVDVAAIPEPSTGFLMLAGLLGAGALTRRRTK